MGGCRCSYKGCENTTKTTDNIHFFHYPVKHKDRCKIWIENANKPQFCDLEEDQLRNKVICEIHFEDKWFPNSQKKRLLQGAIPTIDVECVEEPPPTPPPQEPPSPLYLPSQLHDVQVLPANDDGTIFVLDTDTMFSRSQKVESYIYKNGVIVPANSKPSVKPNSSKPSTSTNNLFPNRIFDGSTTAVETVFIKNETSDCIETATDKYVTQQNVVGKREEVVEMNYLPQEQEEVYEMTNLNSSFLKKPSPRPVMMKNIVSKSVIEKSVGRNYLRKIKQHSRDIASIKRMLKQKTLQSKPDTETFLNMIKDELPPSFFTILNLNLNNKCELSDDDVDFFTTIHKTSPEVYQLLIDKYKWNLPGVDIVETPME